MESQMNTLTQFFTDTTQINPYGDLTKGGLHLAIIIMAMIAAIMVTTLIKQRKHA